MLSNWGYRSKISARQHMLST